VPDVAGLDAFVASLGEGTIHDFAHRIIRTHIGPTLGPPR